MLIGTHRNRRGGASETGRPVHAGLEPGSAPRDPASRSAPDGRPARLRHRARVYRRISGAKGRRPGPDELMRDARRGGFDVVLVWASDRIARSVVKAE